MTGQWPLLSPGAVVRLTLWLMTMPLISGISRLDLRGGVTHRGRGSQDTWTDFTAPGGPKPKPLTCSWASWSTPASRSEETNQTEPQFGPQPAPLPLEPLERHLALLLTFLTSSLQLQALICPLPALSRWQSVDSRQKTGPS